MIPVILCSVQRSLGFVAIQPRNGTITIPAEARRVLRLDTPGVQVEVILRDNDIVLVPHLAISLEQVREDDAALGRDGQAPSR
jgi:bifunctional DNA-binding transcriptional regulator/antitoxin component of YhaV-PrlF toxin-antitoxin module